MQHKTAETLQIIIKTKKHTTVIAKLSGALKKHLTVSNGRHNRPGLVTAAATALLMSSISVAVNADAIGPLTGPERAEKAYQLRVDATMRNLNEPLPDHPHNDDETALADKINSYSKGLPHDENGIVHPDAYLSLINALNSGEPADFDAIIMADEGALGLRNPQAAYSYFMEGKDAHSYTMPAAPAFNSAWQASEAIEVLWQAITRDVPFSNYDHDSLIKEAVIDMSKMRDFRGPKENNGKVSSQTLFRGIGPGETVGPYISQFLLQPIPYGATTIEQKYKVPVAGNDHMTNYNEWLLIQRGGNPSGITTVQFQAEPRYLYNGRALAQYVLQDFVYQAYLGATRIIRGYGSNSYDPNDPYKGKTAEARSPLFGNNHALDFIGRVSMGSQNVAWFQKWLVHRRARPEVFFGRVHNHLTKDTISYPIHADVLDSPALDIVHDMYGTYLLPTATPAGSPLHPSYPAGHAVMAGAAVTMLKAFFNGDFVIPNPVQPNEDGTALVPYTGPDLTIEGELNKLGSNISLGRDVAGVHYRTDGDLGTALGEEYAISVLRELVKTYNEDFAGFTFNKFDGTPVLVSKDGVFFN
ncbi:MAG: vanadium-dependent haloperoxidase [Gammaproteobacteria bacterium]|nr:vanadium-dependent haloperoxidase [Gammaproteobacteria bacterium]